MFSTQSKVSDFEPVKDKEHGGAKIVVRKTCSPELTCMTSKNTSLAGIKKSVCDL